MKKWMALLAAIMMLAGAVLSGMAESAEGGDSSEIHVADYMGYLNQIPPLLEAAEKALAAGMDPKQAGEELYGLADAYDMLPYFTYACENAAAYGTKSWEKLMSFLDSDREMDLNFEGPECDQERIGFYAYTEYECGDALKEVLADEGAEFCAKPHFWTESDFQAFYGTSFSKFKPSRAREGYVCVVLKDDAQNAPETAWNEGSDDTVTENLKTAVVRLMWELGDDAPVLTGNPQLASSFWVFDLTYPFYSWYGNKEVRGFDCLMTLTAQAASTGKAAGKAIGSVQKRNRLPNTIYSWHDWIAEADVPDLQEASGYSAFVGKIRSALQKERSAAASNRKMTVMNAESVLKSVLIGQTEKLTNKWQTAIYESGARDVDLADSVLTFSLRSYDPKISELGAYAKAEAPANWFRQALENAAAYDLNLSLEVADGQLTKKSLQTLKSTVTKAATAAQTAWSGKDMTAALKAWFFPAPVAEKVTSAEQLLQPSEDFGIWSDSVSSAAGDAPAEALAALFFAQRTQTLNVKGGPHEIVMTCTGYDPAALIRESEKAALDDLAYVSAGERPAEEEWPAGLLRKLAENAYKNKAKGTLKTLLTLDVDALYAGTEPEEYLAWLGTFAYGEYEDMLTDTAGDLPEMAATEVTQSSRLTGGTSGTQVKIKIPAEGQLTYVQIRDYGSEAIQGSAIVLPGKTVTLRIPKGSSYLVYGSGPYWYGEEDLFCKLGSYNKSEELEILSTNYVHTFTLETDPEGDVSIYDADPSDFRK